MQINHGEVIWEESFDNLYNWIIKISDGYWDWSNEELQKYFRSDNVQWNNDADAPGGYSIQIDGALNVGGDYRSGFPYIPIDDELRVLYGE